MSKKILNTDAIANELEGASLFFARSVKKNDDPIAETTATNPPSTVRPAPVIASTKKRVPRKPKPASDAKDKHYDTVIPRYHDTITPRYDKTIIELVRKAVKSFGKEAATHRFTQEEKGALADLIYTYRSRGVRTSENEITRIAVNFIVEDFKENGEGSMLDKVLKALNG